VRIPRYLNGPPDAGHGGYVAGSLAVRLPGPGADVWLRAPAPLETDLEERLVGDHLEFWDGSLLIAEADAAEIEVDPVPFVSLEAAAAAAKGFPGAVPNPYETCFGCGRLRADGLGIGPGPVGKDLVACVWYPRGRVAQEWLWSALDCASGWAWGIGEMPLVTGRLRGGLVTDAPLDPADPYVVVAAQLEQTGRKYVSAAALFTAAGQRVAAVRGTWIRMAD
jgi:hypothetical protein